MINTNNIEEYIWMSIDNELSVAQQKELHTYLQQDAQALAQWQAARQTVIQPNESLQMPSKLQLYAIANTEKTTAPKAATPTPAATVPAATPVSETPVTEPVKK